MAVSDEVFILGLEFVIYFILGMGWDFTLFDSSSKSDNKKNIIKIFFIWLILWGMPLMTQYGMEDLVGDKLTLFQTLYQINIWVAWIISVILAIFFILNLGIFISKLSNFKGGG